jgi:hypothetical protein
VRDDARVVVLIDAGYGAQGAAQDRAGQQVAVVLDVRLGQRRARTVPERDSGRPGFSPGAGSVSCLMSAVTRGNNELLARPPRTAFNKELS